MQSENSQCHVYSVWSWCFRNCFNPCSSFIHPPNHICYDMFFCAAHLTVYLCTHACLAEGTTALSSVSTELALCSSLPTGGMGRAEEEWLGSCKENVNHQTLEKNREAHRGGNSPMVQTMHRRPVRWEIRTSDWISQLGATSLAILVNEL